MKKYALSSPFHLSLFFQRSSHTALCLLVVCVLLLASGCVSTSEKMCIAAADGNVTELDRFVKEGGDINATWGSDEFTPLMAASMKGSLDCVKLLVEKGADLNKQTAEMVFDTSGLWRDGNGTIRGPLTSRYTPGVGDCALSLAIAYGRADVVRYLLEHGASFPDRLYCRVVHDPRFRPALVHPPVTAPMMMMRGQAWTTIPALAKQTDNREIQSLIAQRVSDRREIQNFIEQQVGRKASQLPPQRVYSPQELEEIRKKLEQRRKDEENSSK
jgi:ankyrin repeat protein